MKHLVAFFFLLLPLFARGNDKHQVSVADSILKVARTLMEKKDFELSIKHYKQSDSIYKKMLLPNDTLRSQVTKEWMQCLINYSEDETRKGNHMHAVELAEKARKIQLDAFGRNTEDYTIILYQKAMAYFAQKKYKEAIALEKEVVEIRKSLFGTESEKYGSALHVLGYFYSSAGLGDDAIRYGEEAVAVYRSDKNADRLNYAYVLNNLSIYYENKGVLQKAIEIMEEALPIFEEKLDKKDITYAKMLNNAAVIYGGLGKYQDAVRLGKKAVSVAQKRIGVKNEQYLKFLNDLATFYSELGDNKKAIELMLSQLEICKEVLGEKNSQYFSYKNNLATFYNEQGDYLKALELYSEIMQALGDREVFNEMDYALCLVNMSTCWNELGDVVTAIKYTEEAQTIYKRNIGVEHPRYLDLQDNLAGFYAAIGDYPKAIEMISQQLTLVKKVLGENSMAYLARLNNLASYYSYLGNYVSAIKIAEEAWAKSKGVLEVTQPLYATLLGNLANYYNAVENVKGAIELTEESLEIKKRVLGTKHPDIALSLNNLASYYFKSGNVMKALDYFLKAFEIYAETGNGIGYSFVLQNLADCFYELGDMNTAIQYTKESLEKRLKIYGNKHEEYANSLFRLVSYSLAANDTTNVVPSFLELYEIRSGIIQEMFANLTAKEREMYWQEHLTFFEEDMPYVAYYMGNQQLVNAAYDAILLAKGILLDTELEMMHLLQESGDSIVVCQYKELKENRMLLNKLYETAVSERKINVDSLEHLIKRQEERLIKSSKIFGDYTHNMSITWRDVQQKLGMDDIAVEFKHFNIHQKNDVLYVAFVLKKEYESPKMIPLFFQKDLLDLKEEEWYTTLRLNEMLWKPLSEELYGVKNIYFAPTGHLHRIAIENLPNSNGYINEMYNIYRLSSTRELAKEHLHSMIKNVALYGGLVYGKDTLNLEMEIEREAAPYLPGTLREVEVISKLFQQKKNMNVEAFTGLSGTEESLKALGGKDLDVLHIATHGFYFTEDKVHWMKDNAFLQLSNIDNATDEEKALVRSGLFLSGANDALRGNIRNDAEDGVLTAKELANVDFRSLKLAVLSACQSGLGEITGEGVFGIQRGLKKAGAKTLLMSLWKVDDEATSLLMTEFYRNLTLGKDAYESLHIAQMYLRTLERVVKEEGKEKKIAIYSHPYYWAAFVLLDAL